MSDIYPQSEQDSHALLAERRIQHLEAELKAARQAAKGIPTIYKLLREQAGLTQIKTAALLGMSVHYYRHIEAGSFTAPPDLNMRMRDAIRKHCSDLLKIL
jgi:DNA-binding XRE family transcriptional regulator